MSTAFATAPGAADAPPEYAGVPFDRKRVRTHIAASRPDDGGAVTDEPLATFLGLFSIGLGLWELLDPHDVADRSGAPYPGLLRAYGAREVACGLGIMSTRRPAGWLWARVAGDALDLSTAAAAYADAGEDSDRRRKVVQTAAALIGVTVLDVIAATCHSKSSS